MPSRYDVFLSHNSRDKPAVRELGMALRVRGLKVWLDEWELIPGRPWLDALEEVIETIGCAVVLIGKDGLGPWEVPETRACLAEFVGRRLSVIPVLLPGAPERPVLPLFLRQFTWVDLRSGLTAEDLDRLQWGITGVKPAPNGSGVTPPSATNANPEARATADPDHAFTEPLTGIRFLWIPGGRFQMGSDIHDDEKSIHWVRVSPFWLGETPVTNQQYAVFLEKTRHEEPSRWGDCRFSSPGQPVVGMTWEAAQAFCDWLSELSGRHVKLPSEAQWEFAARGTDGREFPWGDDPPSATRACFDLDPETGWPTPVGSYPAGQGPFGTLDQAGNVWEWCLDAWSEKAYEERAKAAETPDPVTKSRNAKEERRVLRGGGWFRHARLLRAACRVGSPSWGCDIDVGFRVAAVPARLGP